MMSELTDVERKRRSERFKRQLRLDLLAGRADQWDVSSPRDELEEFRFFIRKSEEFIDRAETSEVESLHESIQHLSKDQQDEFWQWYYPVHWDDIFRATIRNSAVVSLASLVEKFLTRHCYRVAVTESDSPSFRKDSVKNAREFLSTIGGFQNPSPSEWEAIGLFFKIRNEIVHTQEFGAVSKRKDEIAKFCKHRNDIRLHYGEVQIDPEFLDSMINQLIGFIDQLENEFTSLCERVRSLQETC
jgi:hypothetical protein